MTTPTIQSPNRPIVDEGAARTKEAYNTFIEELRGKLRQVPNAQATIQDPRERPRLLRSVRNQLIGSVPRFQQLSDADQEQFTTRALDEALTPTTRDRIQEGLSIGLPIAGATAGGFAGGPIGAGAGVVAGEFASEAAKPLTTGETPDFIEAIKRSAVGAPLVATGEAVARPIMGLLGKARQKFMLGPEAEGPQALEARRVLQEGVNRRGFGMTPKQLTREHLPPLMEFLQTVAESGMGGQGLMNRQRMATAETINEAAMRLQQALAKGLKTDEEAAGLFLTQARAREQFVRLVSSQKHQIVDDLGKQGVMVNTKDLVGMAGSPKGVVTNRLFSVFKVPEVRNEQGQVIRRGYEGYEGFLQMLNGANTTATRHTNFATADRLRSTLLEISRDFTESTNGVDKNVGRLARNMAERLRTNMDTAAKTLDSTAAAAYADAKAFHKAEVIQQFDDKLYNRIVSTIETEPGKFAPYVLSKENIDKLDILKKMSHNGEISEWPKIQGRLLQHIVSNATKREALGLGMTFEDAAEQGFVRGINGKKLLDTVDNLGEKGARLLLEGQHGTAFRRFVNAVEAEEQRAGGSGKVGTAIMQFGALSTVSGATLGGVLSGGDWAAMVQGATPGVVMLLTPKAISKILTNKPLMNNVADGVIGGPKSAAFGRLVQAIALLNQDIQREVGGSARELFQKAHNSPQALLPNPPGPRLSQAPPS